MEKKKTKLTISGTSKKSFKNFKSPDNPGKKTVVIDKHSNRSFNKGSFKKTSNFKNSSYLSNKNLSLKANFSPKVSSATSDFERRKLAEQRATKRLKGDTDSDKKSKLGTLEREVWHLLRERGKKNSKM